MVDWCEVRPWVTAQAAEETTDAAEAALLGEKEEFSGEDNGAGGAGGGAAARSQSAGTKQKPKVGWRQDLPVVPSSAENSW